MTLATDTPTVPQPILSLATIFGRIFGQTAAIAPIVEEDDCRQRRDDLLGKASSACSCEESLAQMMHLYPGRF